MNGCPSRCVSPATDNRVDNFFALSQGKKVVYPAFLSNPLFTLWHLG